MSHSKTTMSQIGCTARHARAGYYAQKEGEKGDILKGKTRGLKQENQKKDTRYIVCGFIGNIKEQNPFPAYGGHPSVPSRSRNTVTVTQQSKKGKGKSLSPPTSSEQPPSCAPSSFRFS